MSVYLAIRERILIQVTGLVGVYKVLMAEGDRVLCNIEAIPSSCFPPPIRMRLAKRTKTVKTRRDSQRSKT